MEVTAGLKKKKKKKAVTNHSPVKPKRNWKSNGHLEISVSISGIAPKDDHLRSKKSLILAWGSLGMKIKKGFLI